MVGIPEGDRCEIAAARARRKGLTIRFSRRMGAVYARAIQLVQEGHVMHEPLVTLRAPLAEAPAMLARQSQYADEVIKATIYQASAG